MKKMLVFVAIISLLASPVLARTLSYQSQAKAEKEGHESGMEHARPKGQDESYSASGRQELLYENDANRSLMASDRVQQIKDEQYEEAARAKELSGGGK